MPAMSTATKVEINWIDSELITQENAAEMLKGCEHPCAGAASATAVSRV